MGANAVSVLEVAAGSELGPDSSTGAWMGGAISTDAAIAASQSPVGASVTAVGWVPGAAEGNTARATPAASATGSAPATRVVFLVARMGKPSFSLACGDVEGTPPLKARRGRGRGGVQQLGRAAAAARGQRQGQEPGDRGHRAPPGATRYAGSHAGGTLAGSTDNGSRRPRIADPA